MNGETLDTIGQLTATGYELVIDRSPESALSMWRLQLRKPGARTLTVDEHHSLGEALAKLLGKYERATGLKARR